MLAIGVIEKRTLAVPTAPGSTSKVILRRLPSGRDDSGVDTSAMTISISPEVSSGSKKTVTSKSPETAGRIESGIPSPFPSLESRDRRVSS